MKNTLSVPVKCRHTQCHWTLAKRVEQPLTHPRPARLFAMLFQWTKYLSHIPRHAIRTVTPMQCFALIAGATPRTRPRICCPTSSRR